MEKERDRQIDGEKRERKRTALSRTLSMGHDTSRKLNRPLGWIITTVFVKRQGVEECEIKTREEPRRCFVPL